MQEDEHKDTTKAGDSNNSFHYCIKNNQMISIEKVFFIEKERNTESNGERICVTNEKEIHNTQPQNSKL